MKVANSKSQAVSLSRNYSYHLFPSAQCVLNVQNYPLSSQQPENMDRNEEVIPIQGYSKLPFAEIDAFVESDKNKNIEELNKMLNEYRSTAVETSTEDTLIDNLLAQMTEKDLELLQEVCSGQITVNEDQTAVQTAAELIGQLRNQADEEDEIRPATTRRRIETQPGSSHHQDLEQTLTVRSSDVGSSAMHAVQPAQAFSSLPRKRRSPTVLEHTCLACLQDAIRHFYHTAYEWLEMAPPSSAADTTATEPLCVPEHKVRRIRGNRTKLQVFPKADVSSMLMKEMWKGRDLGNMMLVAAFARFFLDHHQFKDLCPSCGTFYKNNKAYSSHMVKNDGKLQCLYRCGTTFTRTQALRLHMKTQHGRGTESYQRALKVFRCVVPGCGQEFQSRAGLFRHTRNAHGSGLAPCPHCRIVLENPSAMNAHLLAAHGLQAGEPLPFACDVEGCTTRCRTENGVQQHKRLVHHIPQQRSH